MTAPDRTTPPGVTELSGMKLPPLSRHTLPNGVRLAILDAGSQPVSRITVIHGGGKLDIDRPELYPVLTGTLSEGTQSMSGAAIAETLEYNGAWTSFNAGRHNCVSTLYGLNSRAQETIPVFADILTRPALTPDATGTQCKKIAAATDLSRKKVSNAASEEINILAYGPRHPAARVLTGADFLSVSADDIRRLHTRAFLGTPPTIYLAGQITDELLGLVEKCFGQTDYTAHNGIARRVIAPEYDPAGDRSLRLMPDSMQTAIRIAIPTLPRTAPDYENMRLATIALGGYFGSRLMANIREDKGYTYGISAFPTPRLEGTFINIECQTDNSHVNDVLRETETEIARLAETLMPEEEITGIRRLLLSSLASVLDSPFSMLDFHINLDALGVTGNSYTRQVEAATAMTPAIIREATVKYLVDAPRLTALAGAPKD